MEERIRDRFSASEEAVAERLVHAAHEKRDSHQFDVIIKDDNVFRITDKAKSYIEREVGHLSTRIGESGPLSDIQLIHLIRSEGVGFKLESPFNPTPESDVASWTIDLTLSSRFFIPKQRRFARLFAQAFDLAKGDAERLQHLFTEKNVRAGRGLTIFPGEYVLASTNEKLTLPDNMAGVISGRSSYARMGLSVELSQHLMQPGHDDVVPLQLKNNLPFAVVLYPGCKIVQLALFRLSGSSSLPYARDGKAKYLGSNLDMRSKYYDDAFYKTLSHAPPKSDWVETALDFGQIALAAASILFGVISLISTSALRVAIFEGVAEGAVVLFVALLVFKLIRRRVIRP